MKTRESVKEFATLMEKQLSLKDGNKGKMGWKELSTDYLFSKIMTHRILAYQAHLERNHKECINQLIHVSNYCMMIADNLSYVNEVEK